MYGFVVSGFAVLLVTLACCEPQKQEVNVLGDKSVVQSSVPVETPLEQTVVSETRSYPSFKKTEKSALISSLSRQNAHTRARRKHEESHSGRNTV